MLAMAQSNKKLKFKIISRKPSSEIVNVAANRSIQTEDKVNTKKMQCTSETKRGDEVTMDGRSRKRPDDGRKESKTQVVETKVSSIPMSPARAMRTEMMKNRFATIILKAQNQTLLCPGARVTSQHRPKTKCCNLQRQREREAARIALEKMEKSVQFEDNISTMKDFEEMIGQFSFTDYACGRSIIC